MRRRVPRVPLFGGITLAIGLMTVTAAIAATTPATAPVVVRPTPWRVVFTARSGQPIIHDIVALGSRDIWAVGDRRAGPFAVHWNGRHWKMATIPHAPGFIPLFLSAPSPTDIWALGFLLRNGRPSAVHWDGTMWHVVSLPTDGSDLGVVFSPSDIWLVGSQSCGSSGCVTNILHWNGLTWNKSSVHTTVAAIGGTSDHDLWLAGMNNIRTVGDQQHSELTVFRWSGTAWHRISVGQHEFAGTPGLTVTSARNVWISGFRARPRPNGEQPFMAVHWDGSRWSVLTVPDSLADAGPTAGDGGNGQWFGPDLHWTGREWIEEVGTWLPSWANPFSFTRVSHIPGTRKAVVGVGSQGGILIGATGRLG
jgi:hypothetical protein